MFYPYEGYQSCLVDFYLFIFISGFMLLATRSGPQGPGKSTPTTEDTCSRRPGVKKVAESVLVGCSLQ